MAGENLILDGMNQEILIRRGCNQCPWKKTHLVVQIMRRQITGQLQKLPSLMLLPI